VVLFSGHEIDAQMGPGGLQSKFGACFDTRTAIRAPLKKALRLRTDHQCASGQREKQTDLFSSCMKWHALFSSLMVLKLPERRVEADGPGDVLGGTLEREFNCPGNLR